MPHRFLAVSFYGTFAKFLLSDKTLRTRDSCWLEMDGKSTCWLDLSGIIRAVGDGTSLRPSTFPSAPDWPNMGHWIPCRCFGAA